VPVGVEGDLDTGVAHLIADVLRPLSVRDEHGPEEVAGIMKSDTRRSSVRGDSTEDEFIEVVGVHPLSAYTLFCGHRHNTSYLPTQPIVEPHFLG
jgi:hypothetical protein